MSQQTINREQLPTDELQGFDAIEPAKLPLHFLATLGQVFLRNTYGAGYLSLILIALLAFGLKVTIWIAEFGDASAGHVLPSLLLVFIPVALLQRYLTIQRMHRGEDVPQESRGVPFLMRLVPIIRRSWPKPPWLLQHALDRPYWTASRFLEPLVWLVIANICFRFPGETDGGRVAAILALIMFLNGSMEDWSEEQAGNLTDPQDPALPGGLAGSVALVGRITRAMTAPPTRQERATTDSHDQTPAAM